MDPVRLRSIAWRATPLWERSLPPTLPSGADDSPVVEQRIRRWQAILGSRRLLRNRLRGTGVSEAKLRCLLAGAAGHASKVAWPATLKNILERRYSASVVRSGARVTGRDRAFDGTAPLPFEEVLIGFVRYAREDVKERARGKIEVLSAPALAALERQLLAHLTFVSGWALGSDWAAFRFAVAPASALESFWSHQPRSFRIYRSYVQHMYAGGLAAFLDSFPVLARLLCQSVEHWVASVVEFCQRFVGDFRILRATFGWNVDAPTGAIRRVLADLSDRHNGGRCVLRCELTGGGHVIYKPRTVKPEAAFFQLVDWLNDHGALRLKSLRVIDRCSHGWVEAVEFAACESPAEIDRFYLRTGMLLAVLHVVSATDMHRENLIANGEHPVVVDLETILSRGVTAWGLRGNSHGLNGSVMSVGMLPFWRLYGDDNRSDMSALGSDELQDTGITTGEWTAINSDQMMLSKRTTQPAIGMAHRVRLGARTPTALEHVKDVISGFRTVYAILQENRRRLLADSEFLRMFDGLNLRILLRATATYTRLQLHSLAPDFLRDGLDRSIELEWLARPLCPRVGQAGPRRIYECERRALEQLDVPHLATDEWRAAGTLFDDVEMRALFKPRNSGVVRARVKGLSDRDCRRQVALIRKSLRLRFRA